MKRERQTLKRAIIERLITNCLGGVAAMAILYGMGAYVQLTESLQSGMLLAAIVHLMGG